MRPKLLDLFCCAGGAAMGYHRAGFDVVGVDINPQPRYPFPFIQADVMTLDQRFLRWFDAIHASPPCQAHSLAQRIQNNQHSDLVAPSREMLRESGLAYVIENVVGAPLIEPVTLCGAMFGLETYRHRLFEANFLIFAPDHPEHLAPLRKMGRPVQQGEFMHIVGNFSGVEAARRIMEMPWAARNELSEAIPPAYTEFIGRQLMAHLQSRKEAA